VQQKSPLFGIPSLLATELQNIDKKAGLTLFICLHEQIYSQREHQSYFLLYTIYKFEP
jgi:hypothetical protein